MNEFVQHVFQLYHYSMYSVYSVSFFKKISPCQKQLSSVAYCITFPLSCVYSLTLNECGFQNIHIIQSISRNSVPLEENVFLFTIVTSIIHQRKYPWIDRIMKLLQEIPYTWDYYKSVGNMQPGQTDEYYKYCDKILPGGHKSVQYARHLPAITRSNQSKNRFE